MSHQLNLPSIIFLYGPAGSGKGTQAAELLSRYPEYEYIEVGQEIRNFLAEFITSEDKELRQLAEHIDEDINQKGTALRFDVWRKVWDHQIKQKTVSGKKLLIDGIFREYNQSMFVANFVNELAVPCVLFVLHISVEEAIRRLSTRFAVPGSSVIYSTLQEAKSACPPGIEPTARADDKDPEVVRNRYRNQYEFKFGECISIYQRVTGGEVYIIDAAKPVDQVFVQIHQNLENFSNKASRMGI
jgi:adenylate kinase family enzyme